MTLIIGGAYQGKTNYAASLLGIAPEEIPDGKVCAWEQVFSAAAVKRFQLLVKRALADGEGGTALARELCEKNPSAVVVCDEIGSGIIPMDKADREWREETGRACCALAEFSETVIRVSCGIPTAIKGELP